MIDRKNVKTIIAMFDIIKQFFTEEAFLSAVFIYIRYGNKIFEKEIDGNKLNRIYEELQKQKILFDKDLEYRIDKILNEE